MKQQIFGIHLILAIAITIIGNSIGWANSPSKAPTEIELQRYFEPLSSTDPEKIRPFGPSAMPILAKIYGTSDDRTKATIAWVMYSLAFKSPEAKAALMKDIHTKDSKLRLQVQWALGRVSDDTDVVEALLSNMQNDDNPLFRDKAACALASDQIHLNEKQKYRLYEGLIQALSDEKEQVRAIAIMALQIQTGQTKNFVASAPAEDRNAKVKDWEQWLAKYKSQL